MSDHRSHPDDDFDDLSEIEETLRNLQPSGLKPDFVRELERDQRNINRGKMRETGDIIFARFVPLMAAACVILLGYSAVHLGFFKSKQKDVSETQLVIPPEDQHLIHGLPPRDIGDGFQPVSAQGIFRNASAGGGVQLDENGQMVREMNLQIEDVYRFHNPETDTRIQFNVPREVIIFMPIEAD